MKYVLLIILLCTLPALAQRPVRKRAAKLPSSIPVKPGTTTTEKKAAIDPGTVSGREYQNTQFGFEIDFPDTWLLPGPDFEKYMKEKGIDLHLINDAALGSAARAKFKQQVTVLLTAYSAMPGTPDAAAAIIAVEDLTPNPAIKDGVDYVDAVRASLLKANVGANFYVGETQAEQLGEMQFAYLDTSSNQQKRRVYVTVRRGYAILLTLSYSKDEDLAEFRQIIGSSKFHLEPTAKRAADRNNRTYAR